MHITKPVAVELRCHATAFISVLSNNFSYQLHPQGEMIQYLQMPGTVIENQGGGDAEIKIDENRQQIRYI